MTRAVRSSSNSWFQFQMVRLKAEPIQQSPVLLGVSIPNGTIKRTFLFPAQTLLQQFQFQMVRLKVQRIEGLLLRRALFQFQMVRLKAKADSPIGRVVYVSIPNGTIKRTKDSLNAAKVGVFQFQMVRLKGRRTVRTKLDIGVSIPNGTIKRQRGRVDDVRAFLRFNSKWYD